MPRSSCGATQRPWRGVTPRRARAPPCGRRRRSARTRGTTCRSAARVEGGWRCSGLGGLRIVAPTCSPPSVLRLFCFPFAHKKYLLLKWSVRSPFAPLQHMLNKESALLAADKGKGHAEEGDGVAQGDGPADQASAGRRAGGQLLFPMPPVPSYPGAVVQAWAGQRACSCSCTLGIQWPAAVSAYRPSCRRQLAMWSRLTSTPAPSAWTTCPPAPSPRAATTVSMGAADLLRKRLCGLCAVQKLWIAREQLAGCAARQSAPSHQWHPILSILRLHPGMPATPLQTAHPASGRCWRTATAHAPSAAPVSRQCGKPPRLCVVLCPHPHMSSLAQLACPVRIHCSQSPRPHSPVLQRCVSRTCLMR